MNASAEMPRYKCHKVVHALQLDRIEYQPASDGRPEAEILYPTDERFGAISIVEAEGMARFPVDGDDPGYLVVYSDGYKSWSPTGAFEEGYTLFSKARAVGPYDFSGALHQLKDGRLMRRAGWNGPDQFIYLVEGSHFEVNRPPLLGIYAEGTPIDYLPHIDIRNQQGQCVPWLASQGDLLADDWEIVELVP